MAILDDIAIFSAVITKGGFSHAAKYLGLSNGLVSRRIAQLEKRLGISLLMRTTRRLHLTPEGELLWQHAKRIQGELDTALCLINSLSVKPKGEIKISAPIYLGRRLLLPIIVKFLDTFSDINVELLLSNEQLDPIKENLDLIIRVTGYLDNTLLKNSSMRMKSIMKTKINLYASPDYLIKREQPSTPDDLANHTIIGFVDKSQFPDKDSWQYSHKNILNNLMLKPKFKCNDIDACLMACISGYGIAKLTDFSARQHVEQQTLIPILNQYDWGQVELFAIYAQQQALPKRTRLLLDFITTHAQNMNEKPLDLEEI